MMVVLLEIARRTPVLRILGIGHVAQATARLAQRAVKRMVIVFLMGA
jgi:hypothetical protein